jgi:hypothetical protein
VFAAVQKHFVKNCENETKSKRLVMVNTPLLVFSIAIVFLKNMWQNYLIQLVLLFSVKVKKEKILISN